MPISHSAKAITAPSETLISVIVPRLAAVSSTTSWMTRAVAIAPLKLARLLIIWRRSRLQCDRKKNTTSTPKNSWMNTPGAVIAFALWLIGMPYPVMWGGIAALLNYVPYFGPIAAAVLLDVGGLMTFND